MNSEGDVRTLRVESLAHLGAGVARDKGRITFIPYTVPGDVVKARITEEKRRFARAEIETILEPSPDRVEPPCPYFGQCGGCQWQHIAYPTQTRYKAQILGEQLHHVGGLSGVEVRDIIAMPNPWEYRNFARFTPDGQGMLGLQRFQSHDVVPIDRCLIVHPLVQDVYRQVSLDFPELVALSIRVGTQTGEQMLILETEYDEPPEIEVDIPVSCAFILEDGLVATLIGQSAVHEVLGGRRYRISPASFFQVNTWGAEHLVEAVLQALEPSGWERVLDLYCGVGLFALALADKAGRVVGVESSPSAIADARANAEGLDNASFVEGLAEEVLPALSGSIDLAVIDPPRGGIHPQALEALVKRHPRCIAYVSCDPATLARDCASLVQGGYSLRWVQPVDMFPQTYHIEAVALLE